MSSFGVGIVTYRVKWSFVLFQGEIFVIMSCSYHVYMFYSHFQIFMHYHTSVVIIVANCIFSVTLRMVCRNVVALRTIELSV